MKPPEAAADLPTAGVYEFGDFRLDVTKGLLERRDGSPVSLTPKVFDTLLFLVHHPGAVLTKERLMEAVWPDSIVEENNLSQNISTLRRVFGDTPGSHRFIVTVAGRGYRFVADVKTCDAADPDAIASATNRGSNTRSDFEAATSGADTADDRRTYNRASHRRRRLAVFAAFGVLAVSIIGFFLLPREPIVAPTPREKGIAVLPFENLSAEKDDAFFADGIQDDILTSIGKIKDLKVIARASVMDYRGARRVGKVREIGETLGVSHVLEGSVRRIANRVVMNVALIDARDERQVWSERYERTLTDTISLQGELAIEIARALRATLTPAEATVAAAKPTQDPQAYVLYLRGREVEIRNDISEQILPAIQLYQQAIDLDPKFALARARLSLCVNQLFYSDAGPEWKAKARAEAEEAVRLQPQLGEARLALTHCYLWGDGDDERALAELARTAELLPNSAEVPMTAAFIYKRQNKYRERIAALHRAEALDPRNRRVLAYLKNTLRWVRDWHEALFTFDQFAALTPDEPDSGWWWWSRANDEFRLTGDINALKKAITEATRGRVPVSSDWLNEAHYETAVLERDYTEAARFLSAIPPETFNEAAYGGGEGHSKAFHEALLAVASNRDAATRQQALEVARTETETRLSSGPFGNADEKAHADLALLHGFLGRPQDAVRETLRAVELASTGSIEKNDYLSALAMVYAHTGEPEKAIDLVEQLLTVPVVLQRGAVYNMTLTDLKWRWQWDPLRSNPRFQKILAGPEPKTVY